LPALRPETVFFDTVYNPIKTPMLKAAKQRGYRTIDGVQMFVKQAAVQFRLWTGRAAPTRLFDRHARDRLDRRRE
jgi:3-dehydroquinate dehydratase/shikimate dehydrogenase